MYAERTSRIARTLDSDGKYSNRTYCFDGCGTKVWNQRYCHGCGSRLLWSEGAVDWWVTHPANPKNKDVANSPIEEIKLEEEDFCMNREIYRKLKIIESLVVNSFKNIESSAYLIEVPARIHGEVESELIRQKIEGVCIMQIGDIIGSCFAIPWVVVLLEIDGQIINFTARRDGGNLISHSEYD